MAVALVPPRVQALLVRHGLDEVPARRVAVGDGDIWRVGPLPGGSVAPVWRALRVWPGAVGDWASIDTRITWLDHLAADGLTVPAPLRDRTGQVLMQGVDASGAYAGMLSCWVPGRILFAALRPVHLHRIGRVLARLHASAERLAARGEVRCDRTQGLPLADWAAGHLPASPSCPLRLRAAVVRACAQLQARVALWPRDPRHWGYLHGDLHPWNLLHHRGQVGVIDFGDSGWGWWAQDFASVLQWLQQPLPGWHDHRARYPALRDALFEGYASLRTLPPGTLTWLDELLMLRRLGTLQWMVEDWPRADHRPWGPAFLEDLGAALHADDA